MTMLWDGVSTMGLTCDHRFSIFVKLDLQRGKINMKGNQT